MAGVLWDSLKDGDPPPLTQETHVPPGSQNISLETGARFGQGAGERRDFPHHPSGVRPMARFLASLCLALVVLSPGRASEIEVGVAMADITPPRGYRMAGYFAERLNEGTRDLLLAKAVVFRQGSETAALVFCDLVSVPRPIATRAREEASRRSGIPTAHIAVAATHSHTGPLYHGVLRTLLYDRAVAARGKDEAEAVDYPAVLVKKVAEAVEAARGRLAATSIKAGFVTEPKLSFNRRFHMKDGSVRFNPGALNPDIVRPAGPIDPQVGVLLFEPAAGGRPFAGLTVFALHLDTVGGTSYSADYPFYVEDELRRTFGPRFVSLFGAGTCGDINHIDVSRRERATTEAIGRTLGRDVTHGAGALELVRDPSLGVATATLDLPLQNVTAAEVAEARKTLSRMGVEKTPFLDTVRAAKVVDLADTYRGKTTRLEVQVFRLGPGVAIVTLPGEVFVEHGLAIKAASPFAITLVVELANACPAYVPTRKAFDEGSYEVVNSRLAPGGGEALVETAVGLLKKLDTAAR
jgi:hypothetical protein